MDLNVFLKSYKVTHDSGNCAIPRAVKKRVDDEFLFCLEQLGGKTFGDGIYRVFRADQIEARTSAICNMFAAVRGKAIAFAADWLGRQFVVDFTEPVDGKPSVTCLEPGVPDSFCTDHTILDFHNEVLPNMADAALAKPLYTRWRKKNKEAISPDDCVGFEIPLFLGGEDKLSNLKTIDMGVYIEILGQVWEKAKDLPDGASIDKIKIQDYLEN